MRRGSMVGGQEAAAGQLSGWRSRGWRTRDRELPWHS